MSGVDPPCIVRGSNAPSLIAIHLLLQLSSSMLHSPLLRCSGRNMGRHHKPRMKRRTIVVKGLPEVDIYPSLLSLQTVNRAIELALISNGDFFTVRQQQPAIPNGRAHQLKQSAAIHPYITDDPTSRNLFDPLEDVRETAEQMERQVRHWGVRARYGFIVTIRYCRSSAYSLRYFHYYTKPAFGTLPSFLFHSTKHMAPLLPDPLSAWSSSISI